MKLPVCPAWLIEQARKCPTVVEVSPPFIALVNGIQGHTDEMFPKWSAFLVLHNDGCRIWQRGGYKGIPKPGERFVLNIHQLHGVTAPRRKGDSLLVVVNTDADTEALARRRLSRVLRDLRHFGGSLPNDYFYRGDEP